jgi:hypothetical protein
LVGALLKNEQDTHLFERLVFMQRQGRWWVLPYVHCKHMITKHGFHYG